MTLSSDWPVPSTLLAQPSSLQCRSNLSYGNNSSWSVEMPWPFRNVSTTWQTDNGTTTISQYSLPIPAPHLPSMSWSLASQHQFHNPVGWKQHWETNNREFAYLLTTPCIQDHTLLAASTLIGVQLQYCSFDTRSDVHQLLHNAASQLWIPPFSDVVHKKKQCKTLESIFTCPLVAMIELSFSTYWAQIFVPYHYCP